MSIDENGNLRIAIENKKEQKEGDKKNHYLRREFSYSNYEQSYTLPEDVEKEKYLRREFSYSNYEQNYTLPEDVEKDKISAKVDNGILTVVLPKMEKKEEKKEAKAIEIS